jgi:hypothetical protein
MSFSLPGLSWRAFKRQTSNGSAVKLQRTRGLFGVWSAGNLDGWVGEDGPLVQHSLGGLEGGRVRVVDKVPHAFCLCELPVGSTVVLTLSTGTFRIDS